MRSHVKVVLRATASKYGESQDSSENSDFLMLRQKDPFGELFSKKHFQSSSEFTFFVKSRKVRNTAQSTMMADGIYPKLYIFNTTVQKEGNLPEFHIHTVCNLKCPCDKK